MTFTKIIVSCFGHGLSALTWHKKDGRHQNHSVLKKTIKNIKHEAENGLLCCASSTTYPCAKFSHTLLLKEDRKESCFHAFVISQGFVECHPALITSVFPKHVFFFLTAVYFFPLWIFVGSVSMRQGRVQGQRV